MAVFDNGLVQMNVKMVVTGTASTVIVLGIIMAVISMMFTATAWIFEKRFWWVGCLAVLAFAMMSVYGANMPRVKEIHACAVEPVQLDRIAAVYDIVSVDGKELVLRER